MTPVEILRAARAKIARPETWTRGSLARDTCGRQVGPDRATACAWCMLGALHVESDADTFVVARGFLERALPSALSISSFNDSPSTTHGDVLAVYDAAIVLAEARARS